MKKLYESPKMEIAKFETEDVLTLSDLFTGFSAEKDNEGNWKW